MHRRALVENPDWWVHFAAIVSASRFSGLCALKVPLRNNCSEEGGPNEPLPLTPFLHYSSQNSVFGKVVFGIDMNSLTRMVYVRCVPKAPNSSSGLAILPISANEGWYSEHCTRFEFTVPAWCSVFRLPLPRLMRAMWTLWPRNTVL